jgi:hypothetical protein
MRDSRRTGIPSRRARSFESAAACTATPMRLRVRKARSDSRMTGTATTATRWSPVKTIGPICSVPVRGDCTDSKRSRSVNHVGNAICRAPRSWATPRVATMRMRRGAVKNRRTTVASIRKPVANAVASPSTRAAKYGTSSPATVTVTTPAARPPISACAKLMMRAAR